MDNGGGPMREKKIYEEQFKKPGLNLKNSCYPKLKHVPYSFIIKDVFLLKAGKIERDGQQLEYQDIRIYLKEK